jgi:hypothetical protein
MFYGMVRARILILASIALKARGLAKFPILVPVRANQNEKGG